MKGAGRLEVEWCGIYVMDGLEGDMNMLSPSLPNCVFALVLGVARGCV